MSCHLVGHPESAELVDLHMQLSRRQIDRSQYGIKENHFGNGMSVWDCIQILF